MAEEDALERSVQDRCRVTKKRAGILPLLHFQYRVGKELAQTAEAAAYSGSVQRDVKQVSLSSHLRVALNQNGSWTSPHELPTLREK